MSPRLGLALTLICLPLSACDSDGDASGETSDSHADHGHDDHGHDGGDTSDAEAMVNWHAAPPATATAGEAFDVMFMVSTTGELHVTEVRVCEGADVADCGLGDTDSYESTTTMQNDEDMYMSSVTIEAAGDYTIVAYAHIGADPHTSEAQNVTVE